MNLNVHLVHRDSADGWFYRLSIYLGGGIFIAYLISSYYALMIMLVALLPFYFYIENMISAAIRDVLHSSTYFAAPPAWLSCYLLIILFLSVTGSITLWEIYPKMDGSFISHYLYCIATSLIIFLYDSSLKCFLLCMGIVNFKMIRRGFFGIIQRFFVICRGFLMIPFWMGYLQSRAKITEYAINANVNITQNNSFDSKFAFNVHEIFFIKKDFSVMIYLLLKGVLILWLLQDIASSFEDYKLNKQAVLSPISDISKCNYKCIICYETQEDPVALRCGHIFCYKCIKRWISDHSTCPLCRSQFVDFRYIEFSDGNFPPSVLFLVF